MFEPAISLTAALDTWPEWGLPMTGPPVVVGVEPAGRTNRSFRLQAPGLSQCLRLRLNNPYARLLGINRDQELKILQAVAGAGLSPGPCYWDPGHRFTVFPYVVGDTCTASHLSVPHRRNAILELLGLIRSLRVDLPRRRYYDYLNHYWQQLENAGVTNTKLRREWHAFSRDLKNFDQDGWKAALTHHDLVPENVLRRGERIYIIDWEYAALGHPSIDDWCLSPKKVRDPFIHQLAHWTNDLWERLVQWHRTPS